MTSAGGTDTNSLLREISCLRDDARGLPAALSAEVVAEVDRLVADASAAVDATISGPDDDALVVGACEAIVRARDHIAALHMTAVRSREIVERSVELRRKSARLLYDRIRNKVSAPLVLVIDDAEDNNEVYEQFLTGAGWQVALAADGLKGLEMAQELEPSVIVLDLCLPALDGWE